VDVEKFCMEQIMEIKDYLFQEGGSRLFNFGRTNEFAYIRGSREAAQKLFQSIETTLDRNTLVYPIVFNYRHYLELQLKSICTSLNYYVTSKALLECEKGLKKIILDNHCLEAIWGKVKYLKTQLNPEDRDFIFNPKLDLGKVDQCVKEFSSIDPKSFAFRYATDREGNPSIPDEILSVDLENYIEKMDGVAMILEAVDNSIAIANEYKNELNSYYGESW